MKLEQLMIYELQLHKLSNKNNNAITAKLYEYADGILRHHGDWVTIT